MKTLLVLTTLSLLPLLPGAEAIVPNGSYLDYDIGSTDCRNPLTGGALGQACRTSAKGRVTFQECAATDCRFVIDADLLWVPDGGARGYQATLVPNRALTHNAFQSVLGVPTNSKTICSWSSPLSGGNAQCQAARQPYSINVLFGTCREFTVQVQDRSTLTRVTGAKTFTLCRNLSGEVTAFY